MPCSSGGGGGGGGGYLETTAKLVWAAGGDHKTNYCVMRSTIRDSPGKVCHDHDAP